MKLSRADHFFGKLSAPPEFPGALSEFFFLELGRGYPILLSLRNILKQLELINFFSS